jgi:hypothetical protein
MERLSQSAADFIHRLADLTNRLASKDIVVCSLRADWSTFGSWELQAQRGEEAERYAQALRGASPLQAVGPEVVRFYWDGRDKYLSVEASPTRFCSSPNEWKKECSKGFDKTGDDLLAFVEDYLAKRFGA